MRVDRMQIKELLFLLGWEWSGGIEGVFLGELEFKLEFRRGEVLWR